MGKRSQEIEATREDFEAEPGTPKSNLQRNLEDPFLRVLLAVAVILFAFIMFNMVTNGIAEKAAGDRKVERVQIQLLEERYGVTITNYSSTALGGWTIDGTDYFCELSGPVDDHSLACVPLDDFAPPSQFKEK